ncbi:17477_t:CDS:1 [Cetraspora pellucida]|uniref:17477_t:CDS:1 n=1 Tax=Cetraspora pellucida TaxID=1433469 RepID=A0A9N9C5C3_9GLOM|nr:17477_t:CDS:1 [Cetraspora pellucida]
MSTTKILITLFFLISITCSLITATVIQPKIDEVSLDSLPETGDIWEMDSDPSPSFDFDSSNKISVEAVSGDVSSSTPTNIHDSVQSTIIGPKFTSGEVQGQIHRFWARPIYINKYKYHWGPHIVYNRKVSLHNTFKGNKFYKVCYADDCRFIVIKSIKQ